MNVWLFSNPGDKVQKRCRTTGQICAILSTRIWTLSPGLENNHTLKCWSGIFPTILTYVCMLENCQNNILVYGCSPIQGTELNFCWNLMKPRSQSGKWKKIMNFSVCTCRSKVLAHSQLNCAPLHDGETVTFRNSEPKSTAAIPLLKVT